MPARFFFVSGYGESLGLAQRLQREGHEVEFFIKNSSYRRRGRGIVKTVNSLTPRKGSIVIIDGTKMDEVGASLRARGFPVIGGNSLERQELNRQQGTRLMESVGLLIPETHSFTNVQKAIRFLEENDGAWFFKPDDAPSYMTCNQPSSESTIRFLKWVEPQLGKPKFEIQRKVVGTEIDVDTWFDGTQSVLNELDIEEKRLLAGELGPRTGCQTNLVWDSDDRIVADVIEPFYGLLEQTGYVGCFSVNCIVTPTGGIYGLEFTARFGYDALQATMLRIPEALGEQLAEFATGNLRNFETLPDNPFALTLHLSVPPYPSDNEEEATRVKGLPLDAHLLEDENFFPYDVMCVNGECVLAGTEGSVGVIGVVGHNLPQMRGALLAKADKIDIPSLQYRTDILKTAEERLDTLMQLDLIKKPSKWESALDATDAKRLANVILKDTKPPSDDSDDHSNAETMPLAGYAHEAHPMTPSFGENVGPAAGAGDSDASSHATTSGTASAGTP